MPIKAFSIADFSQSSTWVVSVHPDGTKYVPSGPSTDTDNKTFDFSTIPAGSIINSALLTATVGGTNYTLRTLDGTLFSGSRNVTINVGGSKSYEFKFKGSGSTASTGTITAYLQYTNVKITVDYTLPASSLTLNKTSCKAGDVIRATITPSSTSYSHKVKFAMTGVTTLTYTLAAGVTYKDFTIPLDWQDAIPSATSRTVTVTLETYSGSTMTGDADKTFTMTLSDDNYPSISGFTIGLIPGHAVAALTFFVQHFSQANLNATAAGLYSATITQYRFFSGAWSQTGNNIISPVLTAEGTIPFTAEVTDSRGRKSSLTQNITVEPYPSPVLVAPVVRRSDALGQAAINGTSVYINSGIIIASLQNLNTATLKARIYLKGTTAPVWNDPSVLTLTPGTPSITGNRLISNSYTIDLLVTDKLASYMFTAEIPTAKALLSGLPGVAGAGIGLFAERENALTSKWPVWVLDDPVCHIRVGNLHISKDPTSPADIWPGTSWDKLPEGTFPMAGGVTYVPGQASGIGGAATVTLTLAQMPKHQHNYNGNISSAAAFGTQTSIYMQRGVGSGTTAASDSYHAKGSDAAHNNMPPFRAYHMWERTA